MEAFFKLRERGTDVRTEVIAGLATFMTMSYIIFVNPIILADAGVPFVSAIAATALTAAICTLLMGLTTNYPFAVAAGMGINAAVAYGMVLGAGLSWQTAMGVIFVEGVLVTLFVLSNVRETVFNAIPTNLKRGIGVGIGLFIAVIGLNAAHFFVESPATKITYNPNFVKDPVALVAVIGLIITAWLIIRKTKGAILIGIVASTLLAILSDAALGTQVLSPGALEGAASVVALPQFGTVFQLDIAGALRGVALTWVFAMLITDFFDTMGTVVAVGSEGGFVTREGKLPGLRNVLLADSLSAVAGGLMGTSSNTTYIESAAGVAEGGRTGLTSVVTAICFALAIFFSPIIGLVPAAATAPALILVGFLMLMVVREFDWNNLEELIPAFLTMLTIPLTYSIAHGIGYGFILYTLIKVLRGKAGEVHWLMYIVSLAFIASYFLEAGGF